MIRRILTWSWCPPTTWSPASSAQRTTIFWQVENPSLKKGVSVFSVRSQTCTQNSSSSWPNYVWHLSSSWTHSYNIRHLHDTPLPITFVMFLALLPKTFVIFLTPLPKTFVIFLTPLPKTFVIFLTPLPITFVIFPIPLRFRYTITLRLTLTFCTIIKTVYIVCCSVSVPCLAAIHKFEFTKHFECLLYFVWKYSPKVGATTGRCAGGMPERGASLRYVSFSHFLQCTIFLVIIHKFSSVLWIHSESIVSVVLKKVKSKSLNWRLRLFNQIDQVPAASFKSKLSRFVCFNFFEVDLGFFIF